jgi:hypothetical protein
MIEAVLQSSQFVIGGRETFNGDSNANPISICFRKRHNFFREISVRTDDQSFGLLECEVDDLVEVIPEEWLPTGDIDEL